MFVKLGSQGEDVRAAQVALKSLGLLDKVDGDFGPLTDAAVKRFQRSQLLKDDGVVGPATWTALLKQVPAELPVFAPAVPDGFVDGWHTGARRFPVHFERIGGAIAPEVVVVHDTDMTPGSMPALVRSWTKDKGKGNAAHFLIGKHEATAQELATEQWPTSGLVQLAAINRNANHAGGGGTFVSGTGAVVHPNRISVGIEVDNGGRLGRRSRMGTWVHPYSGHIYADDEVYVDPRGIGWEKFTEYQYRALDALLRLLDATMKPVRPGLHVVTKGSYKDNGVIWAAITGVRIIGHATLNPTDKTDPGPAVMDWLRTRK
jgi:N-acetyl-anhydromuramyl-L-alanine amidase AmpD